MHFIILEQVESVESILLVKKNKKKHGEESANYVGHALQVRQPPRENQLTRNHPIQVEKEEISSLPIRSL